MTEFWQLPLLMNDLSKKKYTNYTIYESKGKGGLNGTKYKKAKKENRNPFRCLNRIPHNTNLITFKNLKSHNNSRVEMERSSTLEVSHSLMNTLPPLLTLTAPRGVALKAYELLHSYIKKTLKVQCSEQTIRQISILRQLNGSITTINRKISQLTKKGLVILDPILNIIFHSLQAEVSLREEHMETAIIHLKKAEFYSLKIQQYLFAIYCMVEEADIFKSQAKLEKGISCLKSALGLSIKIEDRELQLVVLEKIGMLYYYSGNTAMGEQFHRFAERDLTSKELEMFSNEFNLQSQVRALQRELFSLTPKEKSKTIRFTKYEQEINTDLQQESVQEHTALVKDMVSHMLKDNSQKKIGVKFKTHIRNTLSLAKIIPHSHSPPKQDISNQNLPFVNVSQVLKSHLSRNRGGTRGNREWQIRTLLQMIDSLSHFV